MVVKFFSNKKGGSVKALDYLLNEREKDGTAKVLVGDEQLTRNIINSISFKHKVCVGCLSFEEQNIDEDLKYKIMEDFEKHLLPSLESDQYNILWVEHTDKGRLELNFVIPKIELTSRVSMNPFYHKQDLSRIDTWQNLTNLTYGFTNPKDPAKERTLQGASKKISLQKDYEQLDITLHELVKSGQIKNREQMIELLNENEIFVNRVGSDYISLKLPDSKKARRYKGGIYCEEFRSIGEFENISKRTEQRIDEYNRRDTQGEIRFFTNKLNEYTQRKAEYIKSKYKRRVEPEEQTSVSNNGCNESSCVDYNNDILFSLAKSNAKFTDLASAFKFTVCGTESKVHQSTKKRDTSISRPNNSIYQNKGVKDDSIGTSTKSRATKERETKYRAYLKNRKARDRVYQQITADAESLRVKLGEYCEEQQRVKQSIFGKIEDIGRIIKRLASELKIRIENMTRKEPIKVKKLDFVNESDKKIRRNK
ncbi:relaxase/mobilization nuclease domain-containing protein [Aliarcobacter butzleri]|uniref:relaxase/mobilization nuclease domain-containing protein n=1 Tax=Aliarcobacter butzleri TaxID=28197 RepID=UPI0021B33D99|nr:relaxase/mobilization nuclease domain-containing protein [Aliarcobacter butzleri]MCT7594245.1 relaxase/mobilization nuclease domain-containing protein [Aliarcobacter butzleri]MCT7598868.1 relaxase/mobilization nuclease domain-containing protein [Aliarcobacter butzleri]MCT7652808.1 relaxase/mobilization nuclease domain-containing protein [Aliarcobacter butzleri]